MSTNIVTDLDKLHQKSANADLKSVQTDEIIQQLLSTIPENGIGLAAPQIGHQKRIFIAKINDFPYIGKTIAVFVNPTLSNLSPDKTCSTEGCLSLPGIEKTVSRHRQIKVNADLIYTFNDNALKQFVSPEGITFQWLNAFVIQHENDHLDGILITDLPETKTPYEKWVEKNQQPKQKKDKKKNNIISTEKIKKNQPKINKKKLKRQKQRDRKKIEIQQRYLLEKTGINHIFSEEKPL